MRKKISQREANQLKKRVKQLESNLTNSSAGTRLDAWTLTDANLPVSKQRIFWDTMSFCFKLIPEPK